MTRALKMYRQDLPYRADSLIASLAMVVLLGALPMNSHAQSIGCTNDSVREIVSNETILMRSGRSFEPARSDRSRALTWRAGSYVTICGPLIATAPDRRGTYYRIVNSRLGRSADAQLVGGPRIPRGSCFESVIRDPLPFRATRGSSFVMRDGSVWEMGPEFKYLLEYNPEVIACPYRRFIIVAGYKLTAKRLRR